MFKQVVVPFENIAFNIMMFLYLYKSRIETDLEKKLKVKRRKELETTYYGENTCLPPKRSKIVKDKNY